MRKQHFLFASVLFIGLVALAAAVFFVSPAAASGPSLSEVYWTFEDPLPAVGNSGLVRNDGGINARLTTSGLPSYQAMTMWFIVFNYPELCLAGPYMCGPDDPRADRPAKGDFLWATGNVTGATGNAGFGGRLQVGDTSGSGFWELPDYCIPGYPDCGGPIGLIEPHGALVILAIHSHGPKLTGEDLKAQLTTYTGGCTDFIGTIPGGFAADETEVPDAVGECSTIQVSPHAP